MGHHVYFLNRPANCDIRTVIRIFNATKLPPYKTDHHICEVCGENPMNEVW